MGQFIHQSSMPASAEALFAYHVRSGALARLTPEWSGVSIDDGEPSIQKGARVSLRVPIGPFRARWIAEHTEVDPPRRFVDVQAHGPFKSWRHTHTMTSVDVARSTLEDRIEFEPPCGALGRLMLDGNVRKKLRRMFIWRHARTRDDLAFQSRYADGSRLTFAITGASGFLGSTIRQLLSLLGHRVIRFVRRATEVSKDARHWDPKAERLDDALLEGVDVLIHLAGENVGAGRWTDARKRAIRDSRVGPTQRLAEAAARLHRENRGPKVFVCASAVGLYGDRADEVLDETSAAGEGFLPDVAAEWEGATRPAADVGVRVANMRLGVVLGADGGALGKMLLPFKMGAGGVVGSGKQFWSWVSVDDAASAFVHAALTPGLSGPVNVVTATATNREFTKTVGRVLHRPTVMPLPGFAARLVLGEMAEDLLLASARVEARRLDETHFVYRHANLEDALRFELGRLQHG